MTLHDSDRVLTDALFEEIRRLEESLWRAETRFDKALMDSIFAQDFFEFGRSGRTYARAEMFFDKEEFQEIDATVPLPEFHARHISDEVIQTTYVSEVPYDGAVQRGNRSSIWSNLDGVWRLRFHQGTPLESS
ncbi:MAG: hypothetical protein Kilf2KO_20070 [Rhodospirillales bacterium]